MSNLPPGITDAMIPGNRPEDMAWEEWASAIDEAIDAKDPEMLKVWADMLDQASDASSIHALYSFVALLLGEPSFEEFLDPVQ